MQALVFKKGLQYMQDYQMPRPEDNEALIRVTHAGICNTDLEIIKGYMAFQGIPGHEFVGVIEEAKEKEMIGTRVAGEINISCGICSYCRNQMRTHCPNRSVLGILNKDGAFAEYITLPVGNLHVIPDSIPDEEAVFIEPLAAAFEILNQVEIKPSDKVCVLGDGKLGLLVGQVIATTECNLIVVGKHREKLSILEMRGIGTELDSLFKEKEFDIVIDCTGSSSGIDTALSIVRPRGIVVIKTTLAKQRPVDLNSVVVSELTVVGSRCGPFPTAIKAIESRKIELRALISGVFALQEGVRAFEYASRKGVLKVILEIT